ncbi:trehalose-specific PTS system IIBC protein [Salmonella bongori]|nr:trehalose-specific PTS system IIBC protein [Salmonella bongori]
MPICWASKRRMSGISALFSIEKVGYQAQVIPALLAGLALGFIETRLKRIVPDYLYLVVVPVCSLILAVFLAHAFIGPFWSYDRRRRGLCGTLSDDRQFRPR